MAEEKFKIKQAFAGLNMDSIPSQMKEGQLSFAMNAVIENFDGRTVAYQNEQANLECITIPEGYTVIGNYTIPEDDLVILFLVGPNGESEIGSFTIGKCQYTKVIAASCLKFDKQHPIHDVRHKKNKCGTEVYWTDGLNPRRWIDLSNLPYKTIEQDCDTIITDEVDCNKLNIQPNFNVPNIDFIEVTSGGTLITGTYQFAVQYASSRGDGYTSYYSITNPISIFQDRVTQDFNYPTDKSITFTINNIDTSGIYSHLNVAVIKTINNIAEIELIATYDIVGTTRTITYTGTDKTAIDLTIDDIAERFPFYERAAGLSRIDNVLLWYNLKTAKRHILQKIANKIKLQWVTYRVPAKEGYKKAINTAELRGYMRDEVYPFEIQFIFKNGKETDGFHIPGPVAENGDWDIITNNDAIVDKDNECDTRGKGLPKWKVYNTGEVLNTEPTPNDDCYTGIYQYGTFGYWQSDKTYDCNEDIWGELAGKPIRHHKFPDNLITYHHDEENIYPIGVRLDRHALRAFINESDLTQEEKDSIVGFRILRGNRANNKSVKAKGLFNNVGRYRKDNEWYYYPNYSFNDLREDPFLSFRGTGNDTGHNPSIRLRGFDTPESRKRLAFHSPDTHFYQPELGNHIKIESIEYGLAQAHFVPVKEHAEYKFLSTGAFSTALIVGVAAALARTQIGLSISGPDIGLGFATYNIALALMERLIPSRNFAYQYNAVGNYTKHKIVPNSGQKLRAAEIAAYLTPGWQSVGDDHDVNNYQRESSVYIKTDNTLMYPHEYGAPIDNSRYVLSDFNLCNNTTSLVLRDISSYYGSIKQYLPDQWGDMYSYETISTGYQFNLLGEQYVDIFGGDIFINKFSFKNKLPFFIDNRVGVQNGSDVFYDELGNVAYPTYWFSTDIRTTGINLNITINPASTIIKRILGVKVNNFDCVRNPVFYQDGKIYLFSYGLPTFFVESEVNVDYRQAHNNKEGDFYPHVGQGIPDNWLQEFNVSINYDNTYLYNRTFSKQIKEYFVSHIPNDYTEEKCVDVFPNRVIYSDIDEDNDKKNSWLMYRPLSFKDLPYSYGGLVDIQSLENKAILSRFENRSKIYNAFLTMQTNGPLDAYLGNSKMFDGPSLDFADLNIGYNGTQHKLFVRTEFGHLTVDAERGKIFLVQGTSLKDIGEIGASSFFSNNLPFRISKYFPQIDTDNHFIGVGLSGTYDNVYKRIVITKQDYEPKDTNIAYLSGEFYLHGNKVELTDSRYFCNKSWTMSFSFVTNSWTSFHSYIPRYYIESSGNFYTGIPGGVWEHNASFTTFNNFYDQIHPYILEYPYSFSVADEISQAVIDYTTCLRFDSQDEFYQEDGVYFNKAILYNNQQCSGVRNLIPKPKNSLKQYMSYPKYNSDSIDILLSKVDNKYQYNTFWNIVKSNKEPIFTKSCSIIDKELNPANLDYGPRNFNKQPLRAKELRIRHILDNTDQYKLISNFVIHESQISYA